MPHYRKEASRAHRDHADIFGGVLLASPVHHRLYAAFGLALGVGLVLLLAFGQYSRRISVLGQLLPEQGVIRLYAQATGTVTLAAAEEGGQVRGGAVLFKLSGARYGGDGGDTDNRLLGTITSRFGALEDEMRATEAIQAHELDALRTRAAALARQKANLERQRVIAAERQRIGQDSVDKFTRLAATGFVSNEQVLQKQSMLLEQAQALAAIDKQIDELDEQGDAVRKELQALPLKQGNARSGQFRAYQEVRRELVQQGASKESAVLAPVAGKLTAIMVKPGNVVTPGHLLGTLIPAGARLQANLYVPSQGIGFIVPGTRVYLRYRAFPYQKFGQAVGTVVDISAASMRRDELDDSARASGLDTAGGNEPVYRVRVALASQHVQAQGRAIPLLAGALLDADIMLDRKPLYQWVLDPVGKFLTSQTP